MRLRTCSDENLLRYSPEDTAKTHGCTPAYVRRLIKQRGLTENPNPEAYVELPLFTDAELERMGRGLRTVKRVVQS